MNRKKLPLFAAFLAIAAAISLTVSLSASADINGCPTDKAAPTSNLVGVHTSVSGDDVTYYFDSFVDRSPSGGIPGLIEYCVYSDSQPDGVVTVATGADSSPWADPPGFNNFSFNRTNGNPSNIPLDGTENVEMGTATWSGGPPDNYDTIVLHINDEAECNSLGLNAQTCFVSPGGKQTAANLTVTKTADASYTRTFKWTIDKSADTDKVYSAGGGESGKVNYKIDVTKDAGTDSGWQIDGTIDVANPNDFAVNGVDVSDSTPGGDCNVDDTSLDVAALGSGSTDYTCTFASNPGSGTNTATATWPDNGSPNTSASGTADYTFGAPTDIVNDEIDVDDTNGGSWHFTASGSVEYDKTFNDPAGTCTKHENKATIRGTKQSDSVTVEDCQGADLAVSKTANPSFDLKYKWSIDKKADTDTVYSAGGAESGAVNYTVSVSHDAGTASNWKVKGTITVSNPNDWQPVTLDDLTDAIGNGGTCTVDTSGGLSIPKSGTKDYPYECTYASAPDPAAGTNTATATWNSAAYHTPNGSDSGDAAADFGAVSPNLVDGCVKVNDTNPNGPQGVELCGDDPSPTEFKYLETFTDPAGKCTEHENTASFATKGSKTTGEAKTTVKDCQGADLTVSKTANPSFDLKYKWSIDKNVVGALSKTVDAGQPATFNYQVDVSHDAGTASNWKVKGTITVSNPNDWQAVTLNSLNDAINNGGTCTVDTSGGLSIPKSGSKGYPYECTYASAPDPAAGKNTATATWSSATYHTPNGSASGDAAADFGAVSPNQIDECIDVKDDNGTPANTADDKVLGKVCVGDPNPKTFTYSLTFNGPAAGTCKDYTNTASFKTNDTSTPGSDTAKVTVCSYQAALTPGYWKNHLANSNSKGPWYSSQCKDIAKYGGGCSSNGVWAIQYLQKSLGNFNVIDITTAAKVFVAMNCGSSKDQDAVGCLAGHLLAAKLNVANGANPCINTTIANADAFLIGINYIGPSGTYALNAAQRAQAISLKSALDKYDNGGGC